MNSMMRKKGGRGIKWNVITFSLLQAQLLALCSRLSLTGSSTKYPHGYNIVDKNHENQHTGFLNFNTGEKDFL